jgi:hypothetical protein
MHISLTGELDLAIAPALEKLLAWLHAAKLDVRLDLSEPRAPGRMSGAGGATGVRGVRRTTQIRSGRPGGSGNWGVFPDGSQSRHVRLI